MKAKIWIILSIFTVLVTLSCVNPIPLKASAAGPGPGRKIEVSSDSIPVQAYHDRDGNVRTAVIDVDKIEPYFELHSLEQYAYMDLQSADAEYIPVILEARYRIIYTESWVADEINGWVLDEEGNVLEVLPHFHEVFPPDWEIPCFPPEYNS